MAIFVFLVILILFFGILSSMSTPERGEMLSKDAETLTKALTGRTDQSVIEENKVDKEKLLNLDYETLKRELGVQGDMCIYFEDSNSNLIPIKVHNGEDPDDPGDDVYVNGVGNPEIMVNGRPCGEQYIRECSDLMDNDNDGLVDFGEDPECETGSDNDESE